MCTYKQGFPDGVSGKRPSCQCRRHKRPRCDPWVWKIPWKRAWEVTPVFLPGESHGQRSLASYCPGKLLSKGLQRVRHDWSDLACIHVLTFTDSLFYNFPTDNITGMHLGSCCKNMWGLMPGVPKILWEPSELSAWIEGSELKPCPQADGFALWLWRGRAPANKWDHLLFCFSAVSSLKLMNPQWVSSISKEKGSLISFVGLGR